MSVLKIILNMTHAAQCSYSTLNQTANISSWTDKNWLYSSVNNRMNSGLLHFADTGHLRQIGAIHSSALKYYFYCLPVESVIKFVFSVKAI